MQAREEAAQQATAEAAIVSAAAEAQRSADESTIKRLQEQLLEARRARQPQEDAVSTASAELSEARAEGVSHAALPLLDPACHIKFITEM